MDSTNQKRLPANAHAHRDVFQAGYFLNFSFKTPEVEGSQEDGRQSTEKELYQKLDGDGGKRMIFKKARDRTEDGRDVKRGAVIKDNNGRLITESKEVLRKWAANFKELLNGKGAASCLELPSSVRREAGVEEIGQEEVETAMHKMKKGKATEADG